MIWALTVMKVIRGEEVRTKSGGKEATAEEIKALNDKRTDRP